MIRLLLVDDHSLIRTGIRQLLRDAKGIIEVIGETGKGEEAVKLVRELHPDVVLLDLQLPDISGLEVTARLLHIDPQIKILIFSSATNELFPFRALDAGAHGYLGKDCTNATELVRAIKGAYAGQRIISPAIAARLALLKIDHKTTASFQSLSRKEIEVTMMTIRGLSVKEIAKRLHLSHKTVHSYRSHIFDKLQVDNDVGITLLAIREGLVAIEEAGTQ